MAPPGPMLPTKRPGTLTAAAVITIVMSGIAFVVMGAFALWFLADRDGMETSDFMIDFALDMDMTPDDATSFFGIYSVIATLLAAAAIVLAVMLLQDKQVRIPLVVLSAITILMGIATIVWTIAAILVIVFCFVGGANAWMDAQKYARNQARQW
jgi:hypothetical protein